MAEIIETEKKGRKGEGEKGKRKGKKKGRGKGEEEEEGEVYQFLVLGRRVSVWGSGLDVKLMSPSDAVACGLYTFEVFKFISLFLYLFSFFDLF